MLDFPEHGLFDLIVPALDARRDTREKRLTTNDLEHLVEVGEVRLGFVNEAAERFENGALRIHQITDAAIDRCAAESCPPGDAHAFDVAVERRRKW